MAEEVERTFPAAGRARARPLIGAELRLAKGARVREYWELLGKELGG
jgi:hypothetical protein